jgi:hypothetical protein
MGALTVLTRLRRVPCANYSLRLSLFDFGILVGLLGLFGVLKLRT